MELQWQQISWILDNLDLWQKEVWIPPCISIFLFLALQSWLLFAPIPLHLMPTFFLFYPLSSLYNNSYSHSLFFSCKFSALCSPSEWSPLGWVQALQERESCISVALQEQCKETLMLFLQAPARWCLVGLETLENWYESLVSVANKDFFPQWLVTCPEMGQVVAESNNRHISAVPLLNFKSLLQSTEPWKFSQ